MSKDEEKKKSKEVEYRGAEGTKLRAAIITSEGIYEIDPTELLEALRRRLESMGIGRDKLIAAIQQVCDVDPNDCDMSKPMSDEQMENFFSVFNMEKPKH